MDKSFTYIFFGIQFLAVITVLCKSVFFAAGGGLDYTGYEMPGFSETFLLLPVVFPLTVLTYAIYPKLKNQRFALLLLIAVLISNMVLAIEVLRILIDWIG